MLAIIPLLIIFKKSPTAAKATRLLKYRR
jgi:hypothetical protein